MFRIGEFAQIAQVSGRQLRFYDQLGLLQPGAHRPADRLSLLQHPPAAAAELHPRAEGPRAVARADRSAARRTSCRRPNCARMLTMKRAQVEQIAAGGGGAAAHIESRIAQIDRQGGIGDYDVVTKSVPATPFLALRCTCEGMDEVVRMVRTVAEEGARQIRPALRDKLIVVARNDHDDEKLDLEIGFSLTRPSNASVRIAGDLVLRAGELPAVETMATHRAAGHQRREPLLVRRDRHVDRGQRLRDRRSLPRGVPRTDHRPARLRRRAGGDPVSGAPQPT